MPSVATLTYHNTTGCLSIDLWQRIQLQMAAAVWHIKTAQDESFVVHRIIHSMCMPFIQHRSNRVCCSYPTLIAASFWLGFSRAVTPSEHPCIDRRMVMVRGMHTSMPCQHMV